MYKAAVMGDRESVYGFALIGLDAVAVPETPSAGLKLKELAENGYAVVYMTEKLFAYLADDVAAYRDRTLPAIIPIPGALGNTGAGVSRVKKTVETAVGSDILFGNSNDTR